MRVLSWMFLAILLGGVAGCRSNVTESSSASDPEPGVPLTLATERVVAISNIRYDLTFTIPELASQPIPARAVIRFTAKTQLSRPLALDFSPGGESLTSITVNSKQSKFHLVKDHIVIPSSELAAGENVVDIAFRAGDASLNRNPDFMYTLFVPARAHLAFPCFDQPDLKARYTLALDVPADWQAVANGAEVSRENAGDRVRLRYAETQPLPTYLFAFAAGKFQIESAVRNGRTFRMFHRETDAPKVARNRDAVFDLHAAALDWLESYTGIPYAFGKFDFVLIPSFQFGGMEHAGEIFYNASSILLDESATENQMLNRASTIAHETSHMWFGDLVTMKWFNDVWLKEVFANFMAAKIVNPAFPKVNHELRFLTAHYPAAYAVDRTEGSNPIRQELANLDEAGSLYGPIIYEKAPIVMRQLELILGQDQMRDGLRDYLKHFAFGNATWSDLIQTLSSRTNVDLNAWSHAWVDEAGRPSIETNLEVGPNGSIRRLSFIQTDPVPGRSLKWTEKMDVLLGASGTSEIIPIQLENGNTEVRAAQSKPRPDFVLPTGAGLAYGDFTLDPQTRAFLLQKLPDLKDPVSRGAAWVTLWEEFLDRRVSPSDFVNLALRALPREDTEQNVQLILGDLDAIFWRFLQPDSRQALAPKLEDALKSGLAKASSSSLKSAYFSSFRSIVTTAQGVAFLERIWRRQENIPGLKLAEPDEATMALELAVRDVPDAEAMLKEQHGRFQNPDRKARFEFVIAALSSKQEVRDAWFDSLKDVKNRRREPWVQEGLHYLNHPLRAKSSEKYIRPSLELLVEIQRTGDIFFPTNWMSASLNGYNTSSAANAIRTFLAEHPNYPIRMRRVILQSADQVFRAAAIVYPAGG